MIPTPEGAPAKKTPQAKVKPKPAELPKKVDLRAAVVKWALWGVKNEPSIHYAEVRPIPVDLKPGHTPLTTDCSGSVTLWAKWAGAPDPNGLHFSGAGYTGTLLDHCKHIALNAVRPGDLVVYGPHPGHHVVVVVELVRDKGGRTTDLWVVSHGSESGPKKLLNSVEQTVQPYPEAFLSFLP